MVASGAFGVVCPLRCFYDLLVISDAHQGLVSAVEAALPGSSWQRCRTHYARTLASSTSKAARTWSQVPSPA